MRRAFGEALCTVSWRLIEVKLSQQLSVWVPPMQLVEERDLMSQIESDRGLLDPSVRFGETCRWVPKLLEMDEQTQTA